MIKRTIPFLLALSLAGCTEPLVHQRSLGTLHSQVAQQCKTTPATCEVVKPCAEGVRNAIAAWQGVNAAIAQGDDELELSRTAAALMSEGIARAACIPALKARK